MLIEKDNLLWIVLFELFRAFFIPHAVFWMHSQYTRMPIH